MFAAGAPFRKKPTSLAALGNQHDVNGRLDFPYHEQVLNFQASTLAQLLNPFRLARISDGEMKYGTGSMVSIPDLMGALTKSIWTDARSVARMHATQGSQSTV